MMLNNNYSEKLTNIRKTINEKNNEITTLENKREKVWEDLIHEINENKKYIQKQKGLKGFFRAEDIVHTNQSLVLSFDKNLLPNAEGLYWIEKETGLTFTGINNGCYEFKL